MTYRAADKHSRLSAANMPMAASLARETGLLAIVDSLTADAAIKMGGVVARPIQQELHYHIAIITRGLDSLKHENDATRQPVISSISYNPHLPSDAHQ